MKPTPEQMERAGAALVPYVLDWDLSLNPEHLYELAGAVLEHFDGGSSFDEIDAFERVQMEQLAEKQAALYRPEPEDVQP
jgi:hypothetical protein